MTIGPSEDELRNRIASLPLKKWERPEDLNRISVESSWNLADRGRFAISTGSIRLFGEGAKANQARIDLVGQTFLNLQKIVSATGAMKEGVRNSRGKLSNKIIFLTRLKLLTSPQPGSVIFEIGAESLPDVELAEEENVLLAQKRHQFLDECMNQMMDVLSLAHSIGPNSEESPFIEILESYGPRFSLALRDFAEGLESANFSIDLEWREPEESTKRSTFDQKDAALVKRLVVSHELDQEDVVALRGVLMTLSVETRWVLKTLEGKNVTIDPSTLSSDVDLTAFHLLENITVYAQPKVTQHPGGGTTTLYLAQSVVSNEAGSSE